MGHLSLPAGNDKNRYVAKEELYNEAKKYVNEKIYMSELGEAICKIKTKCKDEVIMVVGSFYVYEDVLEFLK